MGDAEGWTPREGLGEQDRPGPLRPEQLSVWGSPKLAVGGLLGLMAGCVAQSFPKAGRDQACSVQNPGRKLVSRACTGLSESVGKSMERITKSKNASGVRWPVGSQCRGHVLSVSEEMFTFW